MTAEDPLCVFAALGNEKAATFGGGGRRAHGGLEAHGLSLKDLPATRVWGYNAG